MPKDAIIQAFLIGHEEFGRQGFRWHPRKSRFSHAPARYPNLTSIKFWTQGAFSWSRWQGENYRSCDCWGRFWGFLPKPPKRHIPGRDIHLFLKEIPVGKVWGIGDNTAALLNKYGVRTALDFARKQELWVKKFVTKPFYEIWQELNG